MTGSWTSAALTVSAALLACGDDGGGGDGGGSGWYEHPSDFSPAECGDAPVDSIDPVGVWHADLVAADGVSVATFRIDAGGGDSLSALVYGREASSVEMVDGDLIIRREDRPDGALQLNAIDLCGVDQDGRLRGQMVSCYGSQCFPAQVTAYRVEPLDEPEADGMTLLSEWRGPPSDPWPDDLTTNVRHLGTVAYVVGWTDGLRIVDLEDPSAPSDLGHLPPRYPDDELYNDVKIYQADGAVFAFLASSLRGVVVADVTDPTAPVEVTVFPVPPAGVPALNVHTLFIEGDRLYVPGAGLQIFDVSDPAAPELLGAFIHPSVGTLGGFVHDLSVRDEVVYLNYWNLGMQVVDAADPAAPSAIGGFDDYPRRTSHSNWVTEAGGRLVAVHGDEDFDAHVRVVDVDPASETAFQEIGSFQTRPQVSVHNIMAVGERALVTYYQDGLRVLDLADPTAPVEIAHYASWPGTGDRYGRDFFEGAIGVDHDAERDLVLLADTHRGLLVLTLDR